MFQLIVVWGVKEGVRNKKKVTCLKLPKIDWLEQIDWSILIRQKDRQTCAWTNILYHHDS